MPEVDVATTIGSHRNLASLTTDQLSVLRNSVTPRPALADAFASKSDLSTASGMRDVEHAYALLAPKFRAWASMDQASSEGMAEIAPLLSQCIQRDLSAVVDTAPAVKTTLTEFMSSPSAATFMAERKKQGRNEDEIRQRRLQVDVAQAAIKCLAVLFRHDIYFSAFLG